jgi:uncharacterized protein
VRAQRLAGPRPPPTLEGLLEVARSIRCFQLDPIAVAGANAPQLIVFARLGEHDRRLLERLAYQEKRLFHFFAHAASLVLVEDFPIFRHWMRPFSSRDDSWGRRIAAWLAENGPLVEEALALAHERGQIRAGDLDRGRPLAGTDGRWWGGSGFNRLFDCLLVEGRLTISGRSGGERLWSLLDEWLPAWTPREPIPLEEAVRRAAERSLLALGAGTEKHVAGYFTRRRYPGLRAALASLVAEGVAQPVEVAGRPGSWYAHRDALAWLEERWQPRTVLLTPFDNLVADRARLRELFDFDYTIEIYTPAAKRRYGYYSMPILRGDRLLGRLDPYLDRKRRVLQVRSLHLEPGLRFGPDARAAVGRLARFARADGVEGLP